MTITTVNLSIKDGAGATQLARAEQNSVDNSVAFHHALEMGGALIAAGNPLPVSIVSGGGGGGAVTQSGSWTVGITGTLPGFAATPTVNVGTMPSVTLSGTSAVSLTALPPLSAGSATIGNVGIMGTLPAFSATPTVNIGTTPSPALTVVVSTDRGSTITTGGTDQILAAANALRKELIIQNPPTAIESLFINLGAAASLTSNNFAQLPPGASVSLSLGSGLIDQEAVHVIAATAGHVWFAKEFQ